MNNEKAEKIVVINVAAMAGIIGALFVIPASFLGWPLLISIIGFWTLVNVLAMPGILKPSRKPSKETSALRWQTIAIWTCFILAMIQ